MKPKKYKKNFAYETLINPQATVLQSFSDVTIPSGPQFLPQHAYFTVQAYEIFSVVEKWTQIKKRKTF